MTLPTIGSGGTVSRRRFGWESSVEDDLCGLLFSLVCGGDDGDGVGVDVDGGVGVGVDDDVDGGVGVVVDVGVGVGVFVVVGDDDGGVDGGDDCLTDDFELTPIGSFGLISWSMLSSFELFGDSLGCDSTSEVLICCDGNCGDSEIISSVFDLAMHFCWIRSHIEWLERWLFGDNESSDGDDLRGLIFKRYCGGDVDVDDDGDGDGSGGGDVADDGDETPNDLKLTPIGSFAHSDSSLESLVWGCCSATIPL